MRKIETIITTVICVSIYVLLMKTIILVLLYFFSLTLLPPKAVIVGMGYMIYEKKPIAVYVTNKGRIKLYIRLQLNHFSMFYSGSYILRPMQLSKCSIVIIIIMIIIEFNLPHLYPPEHVLI